MIEFDDTAGFTVKELEFAMKHGVQCYCVLHATTNSSDEQLSFSAALSSIGAEKMYPNPKDSFPDVDSLRVEAVANAILFIIKSQN